MKIYVPTYPNQPKQTLIAASSYHLLHLRTPSLASLYLVLFKNIAHAYTQMKKYFATYPTQPKRDP